MTQREFFERVLSALEAAHVPYMVVGSVSAMLYGEPRLTNDMDVVVEIEVGSAERVLQAFSSSEYYVPPTEAVRAEILRRGQFNIIHAGSGSKTDLIIRKDDAFAREEFSRRRAVAFSKGMDCISAAPEDIVLSKLRAFQSGGAEKHLLDVRGILSVSGPNLDLAYVERWVREHHLEQEWRKARSMPRAG